MSVLPIEFKRQPLRWTMELILRLLAFVMVPAFLALGMIKIFEQEIHKDLKIQRQNEMEQILSRMNMLGDPHKRFQDIFQKLSQWHYPSDTYVEFIEKIQKANEKQLEIYLFDTAGKLKEFDTSLPRSKTAAEHFMSVLLGKTHNIRKILVDTFAGSDRSPGRMAKHPRTLVGLPSTKKTWGGWWPLRNEKGKPSGHMIVFVIRSEIDPDTLLDSAAMSLNVRYSKHYHIGWKDPAVPDKLRPAAINWKAEMVSGLNEVKIGESMFEISNRSGMARYTQRGEVLFCIEKNPVVIPDGYLWAIFITQLLSAITGSFILFYFLRYFPFVLGFRGKLVLLLAVCGAIPVMLLLVTGIIDRHNREAIIFDDIRRSQIETITRIDEDLLYDFDRLSGKYRRFVRNLEKLPYKRWSKALENIPDFIAGKDSAVTYITIVNRDGETLLHETNIPGEVQAERGLSKELVRLHAVKLLQAVRGDLFDETKTNSEDVSFANEAARNATKSLYKEVFSAGFRIQPLNLLGDETPACISVIADKNDEPAGILMAFHDRRPLQSNFLHRLFKERGVPGKMQSRFVALPIASRDDWPAFPRALTARNKQLIALRDQATASKLPCHALVQIRDGRYLVSALQGNQLDGYVLMLAQPLDFIYKRTRILNYRLAILALLITLLVCGMAWTASTMLLNPLGDLQNGLEAITARNFRTQIKRGKVAELDNVAQSLNQILDNLRELEIAKTVQEHLWPEQSLSGSTWKIVGRCVTATDLGGDHHDWFMPDSDKVLMVIGDVAGHGIASSLVEAAVKISLAVHSETTTSPAELLTRVNRDLIEQGFKKLPMTFWIAVFDITARKLTFSGAGHCYPLLLKDESKPEYLKSQAMPLGIRKKCVFQNHEVDLGHEGLLIMYTDGLVEAKNTNLEMFSFDRLVNTIDLIRGDQPEKIINKLIQTLAEWSGSEIPDDDQTVVVFKYTSGHIGETV